MSAVPVFVPPLRYGIASIASNSLSLFECSSRFHKSRGPRVNATAPTLTSCTNDGLEVERATLQCCVFYFWSDGQCVYDLIDEFLDDFEISEPDRSA